MSGTANNDAINANATAVTILQEEEARALVLFKEAINKLKGTRNNKKRTTKGKGELKDAKTVDDFMHIYETCFKGTKGRTPVVAAAIGMLEQATNIVKSARKGTAAPAAIPAAAPVAAPVAVLVVAPVAMPAVAPAAMPAAALADVLAAVLSDKREMSSDYDSDNDDDTDGEAQNGVMWLPPQELVRLKKKAVQAKVSKEKKAAQAKVVAGDTESDDKDDEDDRPLKPFKRRKAAPAGGVARK